VELQEQQTESKAKLQQQLASLAVQQTNATNPKGGKSKAGAPKLDEPEKAPKLPEEPLLLYKDTKGQLVAETVLRFGRCYSCCSSCAHYREGAIPLC
jgi:hypothetical protein